MIWHYVNCSNEQPCFLLISAALLATTTPLRMCVMVLDLWWVYGSIVVVNTIANLCVTTPWHYPGSCMPLVWNFNRSKVTETSYALSAMGYAPVSLVFRVMRFRLENPPVLFCAITSFWVCHWDWLLCFYDVIV